ncbi:MAG: hypothetical protein ACYC3L_11610 [Gemmatimonadaceae bacterium]
MITSVRFERTAAHLRRVLPVLAAVLLMLLVGAAAGCQGRNEVPPGPARILFDSLVAAHEAMYDSATADLGYGRMSCLKDRAESILAFKVVTDIGRKAENAVRARHSRAEWEAGARGIASIHPVGDLVFCRRVDSLWYARVLNRAKPHL